MKLSKSNRVLLLYVLGALVIRFFTYFPSVINHDESTYIVIAQALLGGDVYWVDVVDTKPAGIFLLFGLFQMVFGYNILSIRIMASVWVALTAFFLYRSHLNLGGDQKAAFASGCIYIFIISFFTFFGLSPNTELFLVFFTALGLFLITANHSLFGYLLAGLALGFGFIIKPVVMFDMLAFLVLIFIIHRSDVFSFFKRIILFGGGCLIPFLVVAFYYWNTGHFEEFRFYTFEVSGNYLLEQSLKKNSLFFLDFFARFLPVTLWFAVGFFSKAVFSKKVRFFILVWSVLIWFALFLPGKAFSHYTIQFMVPFAFLAGSFFDNRQKKGKIFGFLLRPKVGYPLLALLLLVTLFVQKKDFVDTPDTPRKVAKYLKPKTDKNNWVYSGDTHHIIYTLLNQKSPSPYVHRSLLWTPELASALNIDPLKVYDSIQNDTQIQYILHEKEVSSIPDKNLFELDTVIGHIKIYQRN